MTTYNKSEIMKNAWTLAKKMAKYGNGMFSSRSFFASSLEKAWAAAKAKIAAAEKIAAVKSTGSSRYIELASVAYKNNMNHGKTWVADGYTVDKNSLDPSWEGQAVCYVYVA